MPKKVFGIGFHKTGTSSLGAALHQLGYHTAGTFGAESVPGDKQQICQKAIRFAEKRDAFQDVPWFLLYEEMDRRYPGSKFILTLRPPDEWIESMVRHFGGENRNKYHPHIREWIYGVTNPEGHEETYVARYERHNDEVMEYFSDRPDDLLVLRLTEGEGWEKLCPFLGKEIPSQRFPHHNKAKARERRIERRKNPFYNMYRYLRKPDRKLRKLYRQWQD